MNETNEKGDELLMRAEAALAARGAGAVPPVELVARVAEGLGSRSVIHSGRRYWTMKRIFGTSMAGGIAAAVVVGFMIGVFGQGGRLAFGQVAESLRQVRSLKMKMAAVVDVGGQKTPVDSTMYVDEVNRRMRQEMQLPGGLQVNIFDMKAGKGLMLTPGSKTAVRLDLAHVPKGQAPHDLLERLKNQQETGAKDLSEKEMDGRKVHGFLIEEKEGETTTETRVWVDPATKMPVVVEQTIRNGFLPMEVRMSEFEWNGWIDESLLKLEIPEGYTVSDGAFDMGKPTEKDLLAALKASTRFNGGRFPKGLTMQEVGESLYESLADKGQMERVMQEEKGSLLAVARGWAFISDVENGSEWHWAGTGVVLGEKGRAIVWYRPKGKRTYSVIDADLRVHEEEQAPAVGSRVIEVAPATEPVRR